MGSVYPESGGTLTVPISHLDAYVYGREGVLRCGGEKREAQGEGYKRDEGRNLKKCV